MDSRTSMSSDIPSESSAHPGTTLDALGQAASKAEQAACRYRDSTALPFTQLDFETEHPEWSLSARAGPQVIGFPGDPVQVIPKARGRPRKLNSKEQGSSKPANKRTSSGREPGLLGTVGGRAMKQSYKDQGSLTESTAQYPSPRFVPSKMSKRKSYSNSVSHPSIASDNDPGIIKQTRMRETERAPSSDQDLARKGMPGNRLKSQAQDEDPWSIYREVVNPIIQSLNSHYEEIYPQLDVSVIRQEVLDEIMETLLPDLIRERQTPKKRHSKVVQRFAKELWEQKLLQHVSKQSSSRRSSSSHAPDLSLLGPGASSVESSWGKVKSFEKRNNSISSQLESIGLSPEPEDKSQKYPRSYSLGGHTDVADQETANSHKHRKVLHIEKENKPLPAVCALESPSDHLFLEGFGSQKGILDSSKNQIFPSINIPWTSNPDNLQEGKEKNFTGGLNLGKDQSRLFSQGSTKKPVGPLSTLSQVKSSGRCSPISRDWTIVKETKSRVGHPETIDTGQDLVSKSASGFSVPEPPNPLNLESLLDTGHDPRITMTELNPIQIPSDDDDLPLHAAPPLPLPPPPPPAPSRARIVRRGTSSIHAATSRMAPSRRTSNPTNPVPSLPTSIGPLTKTLPPARGAPPPISTSSSSTLVFPSKSIKGPDYLSADPALEHTLGALNVLGEQASRPYKVGDSLEVKDDDAPGAIKHVDFADTEFSELTIICNLRGSHLDSSINLKDQLKGAVLSLSSSDIAEVAHLASKTSGLVSLREQKSIRRFLRRLQRDDAPATPSIMRVEAAKFGPHPGMTTQTLLRRRANGLGRDEFSIQRQLRETMIEAFTPQRSWKGASGDIVSIAWHPNSQTYTIGATATSNDEDLQYNRPNNLLYGDVNHNTLHELPDHYIDRPRPDTIAKGPNASEAVYAACDPKVYKTVSAIQYSPNGSRMFTASHDKTVKIWDVPVNGLPSCNATLAHDAILAQLSASTRLPNVFATGSTTTAKAIRVYHQTTDEPDSPYGCISLGSTRAQAKPQHEIVPECLVWGNTPATESLLLAGFARWGELPNNNPGRQGDLCIWDLNTVQSLSKRPSSQSVTAASFHPFLNVFGTGGSPGTGVTRRKSTRTVVRLWDIRQSGFSLELDCPALDMGDLVFHPWNKDIVAVGCTDGAVYVWDARKPDYILHKLQHGEPISDWDNKYGESPLSREQGDAGVTMTLWSKGKNHLYTGATDGMVKLWDVNRAPEDVLIKDITQLEAGVASATFSPDYAYLIIGDSTGGVHLLTSGPGYLTEEEQKFSKGPIRYIPTPRNDPPVVDNEPGQGQLAAQELLSSGQLTMHPIFGVGQGPAYAGPYAAYAHEAGPPNTTRLLKEFEKQQPVSRKTGRERDNAAAQNIIGTLARRRYELSQHRQPDEEPPTEPAVPNPVGESSKPSKKRKRSPRPNGYLEYLDRKKARMSRAVDSTGDNPQDDGKGDVGGPADELEDYDYETYEDDHWFPHMDLEVFEKLGINP
ncbi:MAG: hypothetical protein Q9195_006850 [Heterodermia aff. obscurata]